MYATHVIFTDDKDKLYVQWYKTLEDAEREYLHMDSSPFLYVALFEIQNKFLVPNGTLPVSGIQKLIKQKGYYELPSPHENPLPVKEVTIEI